MTHLDTGIADVANFLAVELLPFLAVKLLDERNEVLRSHHVDESIAHIALVLEVNGQVEEVIGAAELFINRGEQHLLCVLVRDVLDHERRAFVLTCKTLALFEAGTCRRGGNMPTRREHANDRTVSHALLTQDCAAVRF